MLMMINGVGVRGRNKNKKKNKKKLIKNPLTNHHHESKLQQHHACYQVVAKVC